MPRLGVVGTLVWDTIYDRPGNWDDPVEEWGGIAYSLAGFDAALPNNWSLLPIVKVGQDMRDSADTFLKGLVHLDSLDGIRTVAEPNNRVELIYVDEARRHEKLSGGVPGWTLEELLPVVRACDALYVNFIAGWELDLQTASVLRNAIAGPTYMDLHSLMLGLDADGVRNLRPLRDWRSWLTCFDIVQLNEDELTMLAGGSNDPWVLAAKVIGSATRGILITRGDRGSTWVSTRDFAESPLECCGYGQFPGPLGPITMGRVPSEMRVRDGDPTGCGDVWGGTCFSHLLAGADLNSAMRAAGKAGSRNAGFRGASRLSAYLQSSSDISTGVLETGKTL
tara:strand:- start:11 stop:1021 length:1011 start_codon:yes stop_codon:yes gene_type:complete